MVRARAAGDRASLGRAVVGQESDGIAAIPEPLRSLEASGAIVATDAMGRREESAGQIRGGGGADALAVKPGGGPVSSS